MTRIPQRDVTAPARDWLWIVIAAGAVAGGIGELAGLTALRVVGFAAASAAVVAIVIRAVRRRIRGWGWNDSLWG